LIANLAKSNTISTSFSILKQSINVSKSIAFDNLLDDDLLYRVIDFDEIEVFQDVIVLHTIVVALYAREHHLIEELVFLNDLESHATKRNDAYLPRSL